MTKFDTMKIIWKHESVQRNSSSDSNEYDSLELFNEDSCHIQYWCSFASDHQKRGLSARRLSCSVVPQKWHGDSSKKQDMEAFHSKQQWLISAEKKMELVRSMSDCNVQKARCISCRVFKTTRKSFLRRWVIWQSLRTLRRSKSLSRRKLEHEISVKTAAKSDSHDRAARSEQLGTSRTIRAARRCDKILNTISRWTFASDVQTRRRTCRMRRAQARESITKTPEGRQTDQSMQTCLRREVSTVNETRSHA